MSNNTRTHTLTTTNHKNRHRSFSMASYLDNWTQLDRSMHMTLRAFNLKYNNNKRNNQTLTLATSYCGPSTRCRTIVKNIHQQQQ